MTLQNITQKFSASYNLKVTFKATEIPTFGGGIMMVNTWKEKHKA
jgi:hypothetical protein